jgi:hypothetical protein
MPVAILFRHTPSTALAQEMMGLAYGQMPPEMTDFNDQETR